MTDTQKQIEELHWVEAGWRWIAFCVVWHNYDVEFAASKLPNWLCHRGFYAFCYTFK